MLKQFANRQFLTYLLGGVLSAGFDIGVMQLLISSGMPAVPAASTGYVCGLLVNYGFHARVTFKQFSQRSSFVRYLGAAAANYLLTIALVAAAEYWLGSALAGKLVSLPLVALNGFLLGKYWIFKRQ